MLKRLLEQLKRIPKPVWIAGLSIIVYKIKVSIDNEGYRTRMQIWLEANAKNQEAQLDKENQLLEMRAKFLENCFGISPQETPPQERISKPVPAVPVSEPENLPQIRDPVENKIPDLVENNPSLDEHPFTQFLRLHLRPRPANHPIHYDQDHNELPNVFEALR